MTVRGNTGIGNLLCYRSYAAFAGPAGRRAEGRRELSSYSSCVAGGARAGHTSVNSGDVTGGHYRAETWASHCSFFSFLILISGTFRVALHLAFKKTCNYFVPREPGMK